MNKVIRSISAAALLLGIFVSFSLSARAGTLSVTNGSFTNLTGLSGGPGWYGGFPAGWSTTAASNAFAVLNSSGTYYANLDTLAPSSATPLRQNVGTIDVTSDISLSFTLTTLQATPTMSSGIYNLANSNSFATFTSSTINGVTNVTYTARGVAPGTELYIAFWDLGAGAPGLTGVSILDSATTYLWNGGVSGVWTNGGGGWTDKFDSTATNYGNAKPVVAQFTNAAAGTNVSVGGNVVVGNVQVSGTNYTFSGGSITMTNTTWSVGASVTNIVASTLAGTTGLAKSDSGTLALDASNSYSGTTAVNAGRLAIVNGNALGGTADGTIVASGAQLLLVATNSGFTVGSEALTISGQGVTSGGALRNNSGGNTWQGNITLAANATIGAATNSSLTLDVAAGNAISGSGHSLTFDGAGTNRVLDSISLGAGAIIKTGTGQTILAASNSYSGGTTLSAGTLALSNANALGSGNLTVNGGTLDLGGNNLTAANLGGTGGTISLGANTLTASMTTGGQFDGTISGSGGLVKTGASFLTLAGSNSYAGGTTVNAGTLFVIGSGTLGDAAGTVTISNAVLDLRNQQTRTGTIMMIGQDARLLSGTGAGSLVNNGGALQFGGGQITNISISGTGGLNVTGGGSLNSSNSFTGATTISATPGWYGANTLFVVNAHALGAASGDLTISGGTVNLQDNTIARSGNVTISGGTVNAGTLSKDGGNFGIQGGTINAVLVGTAGLVKSGAGTATLGASNSYAGAADLQAGTLSLSGAGRLGGGAVTIGNGATLAIGTTGVNLLSNNISGAGAMVADSGDTRITGAVTTTGGLTINAGTVRIGNSGTTGSYSGNTVVGSGATLAFSRTDAYTHTGAISGAGAVTKVDSGAVTLTASNSYSGVTTLFAGALVASNANALGTGNITFSSGGGNTGTIRYTAESAGTDWASRIKNSSGTIRLDTDAHNVTLAGAIDSSNTQGLTKSGSGSLTLGGVNAYTGSTTIQGGLLVVNGSVSSATTVQSGASLGGSGTVASVTIQSGGTIAPGNSPGTLTITNGLTWAGGGNYNWQIFGVSGAAGQTNTWDLINVTGGTWDINGLSSTNRFNINLWSLSGLPETSGALSGFDATQNYSWKILASVGLTGTFNTNLFNINTAAVNGTGGFTGAAGLFSLAMDDNNDLFLNYTGGGAAVPEPGTWAAAALLAAAVGLRRILRRRSAAGQPGSEVPGPSSLPLAR